MAVSETPRHKLKKYSAGTDPHPTRTTFNSEVDKLEALPAIRQGSPSARPPAGIGKVLFWDESTKRLHLDDGTAWQEVTPIGGGGAGAAVNANGAGAEGTSPRAARTDHTHPLALATSAAHGAMHKDDKALLAAATAQATPNTIARRGNAGELNAPTPTNNTHLANKAYVDGLVAPLADREPIPLGAAEDLNTKVTTQKHHQATNNGALGGKNYPVPEAGYLDVTASPGSAFVYHTYHTYGSSNQRFHRTRYNGAWSVWKETTVRRATQAADGLMSSTDKTKLDTATSYATPNTIPIRNAAGAIGVGTPADASHAANKSYVDAQDTKQADKVHKHDASDTNSGVFAPARIPVATQSTHGAIPAADKKKLDQASAAATPNTLMMLDGNGRARVADPAGGADIANKNYVDNANIKAENLTGVMNQSRLPFKLGQGTFRRDIVGDGNYIEVYVEWPWYIFTNVPTVFAAPIGESKYLHLISVTYRPTRDGCTFTIRSSVSFNDLGFMWMALDT